MAKFELQYYKLKNAVLQSGIFSTENSGLQY